MRLSSLIVGLVIACAGGGCMSLPPIDSQRTAAEIGRQLSLDPGTLTKLSHCQIAKALRGEKLANFEACIYAQMPKGMLFAGFDEQRKVFRQLALIEAESTHKVGYKTMGAAKQVQVHGDDFVVFTIFVAGEYGDSAVNKEAFDHLRSLGVAEAEPLPMVMQYQPLKNLVIVLP